MEELPQTSTSASPSTETEKSECQVADHIVDQDKLLIAEPKPKEEIPSSSNSNPENSEDIDSEDEDDTIVTMVDVLKEQTDAEEGAMAVLGDADDKICSYSQGYSKRQPLYACRTCCTDVGGVCLACSYHCHDGHDLVELYTKRDFRCDCGNSMFGAAHCTLLPDKDATNEKNAYNHNFSGLYCVCDRPYPDPDDNVEDAMLQCVVCEDWFHSRHLKTKSLPDANNYDEMICHICMEKLPFLRYYLTASDEVGTTCKLEDLKKGKEEDLEVEATFWQDPWRSRLCKCNKCLLMYDQLKVPFLLDDSDTTQSFELRAKSTMNGNILERERQALNSLDHVSRIETVRGFMQMKDILLERLHELKDKRKIVSAEDVWDIFGEIKAKRAKISVPPNCR